MKLSNLKLKEHYLLIIILIFASILLSINLDKPFIGHHDWNGVWYSNFARNFVRYGLIETKFGQVLNYDFVESQNFVYSTHYPPIMPIFIAVSFKVFGIHEWSARIVPLIFSLGTITMVYSLGYKFFNPKVAVLAAAFLTILPIVIYFGKIPVHEVLVLPFVLFSIFLYFDFFKDPTRQNFLKLILCLILSHLVHWSGYFVTPLFALHFLMFSKDKKKWAIAIFFLLLSMLLFFLHLAHVFWLTGTFFGGGLLDILLDRLNITDRPADYTTANFIIRKVQLAQAYFTRPIILLSALTFILTCIQVFKHQTSQKQQLIIMLGLFGIAYNVLFRNAAFIHDYTIIYLLPFLVLAAAGGFFAIVDYLKITSPKVVLFLAVMVWVLTAAERINFTKALSASNSFLPGVTLGKIINQMSQSGDRILILSPDFKQYFEVFTGFYADRQIDYKLLAEEDLPTDYKLIVAIPSRDTPKSLVDILQQHYKVTKINQFVIFDLHDQKQISFGNYSHLQ